MSGATPPLPSTPLWRGDHLKKHRDKLAFIFIILCIYTYTFRLLCIDFPEVSRTTEKLCGPALGFHFVRSEQIIRRRMKNVNDS
jgi:hypothetical protein